jgi:hypothetical protein
MNMLRCAIKLKRFVSDSAETFILAFAVLVLVAATARIVVGASSTPQKTFQSPEEGVQELIKAAKANDVKALLIILGPEAKPFMETGDPVSDRESRERFVKFYEDSNKLVKSGDKKVILEIGKGSETWPFPIPLVQENAGWHFDTKEGKEEILNRKIGRNELDVIQVCLAYVDAQREYYQRNPQNDVLLQYAQKFLSTKGKRDGLYWQAAAGEQLSPFGPFAARARSEGYQSSGGKPVPYHGYYYKILTGQGPHAPDGAYDYIVRGKMIGGFGLVAYPAQYGSSGIMTFIVNHDGVVYQKDLGSNTASVAQSMSKFDPDKTWMAVP